jgi:hypothetical protein
LSTAAAARRRRVTDGNFFNAFFHVLWLFIGKKHILSKKNFSKFFEWNQYFPLYISYMRKVKNFWRAFNWCGFKQSIKNWSFLDHRQWFHNIRVNMFGLSLHVGGGQTGYSWTWLFNFYEVNWYILLAFHPSEYLSIRPSVYLPVSV